MKRDADEAVERVLSGLRAPDVPADMELRVLAALQERAAEPSRWSARPWAWAAAAVLVAGMAWPAVLWLRHQDVTVARHPLPVQVTPQPVTELPQPLAVKKNGDISWPKLVMTAPRVAEGVEKRVSIPGSMRRNDELALREMHAPSRLVPPEPLTAQERRLQQIVQRGVPSEMAAVLNPEERSARYETEKAAVTNFFEPAKVESSE